MSQWTQKRIPTSHHLKLKIIPKQPPKTPPMSNVPLSKIKQLFPKKCENFLLGSFSSKLVMHLVFLCWSLINMGKVHILWEGHKILQKSPPYFWLALHWTKVRWRFRKILWPSQNIWTLLIFVNSLSWQIFWSLRSTVLM